MGGQKRYFLYALILTVVVFNFGIFMGYLLESSRADKIDSIYLNSEIEILDQITQKSILDMTDLDCDLLFDENVKFGDRIFEEALKIQKYEEANVMKEEIKDLHRRFDILRTLFWTNSIKLKDKCNMNYHTLVYLYNYNDPTLIQHSKQSFFSNLLMELKEKYGNKIILIPIAVDNDLPAVNLLLEKYEITETPVILIDESVKITDIDSVEEIENYLI